MHFSSLLISSFLLASAVLAERPRELRRSLLDLLEKRSNVDVTTNYLAGAVLEQVSDGSFYSVCGTLTIPNLAGVNGVIGDAFVGLDYDHGCDNFFQSGITFGLPTQNDPTYNAWYQWYPDDLQLVPNITMSAGDVLEIEVKISSLNMVAHMNFKNQSKNQTFSLTLLSQYALCLKAAGWFVQAYSDTQLADFGTMAFEDAVATVNGDFPWHPKGATIYGMEQNGQYLTSVSVDEDSVTFKYTGP